MLTLRSLEGVGMCVRPWLWTREVCAKNCCRKQSCRKSFSKAFAIRRRAYNPTDCWASEGGLLCCSRYSFCSSCQCKESLSLYTSCYDVNIHPKAECANCWESSLFVRREVIFLGDSYFTKAPSLKQASTSLGNAGFAMKGQTGFWAFLLWALGFWEGTEWS